jgi:hypothetical protein
MGGKNLASLAALGALGMMMSKGKGGNGKESTVDTSGVSDMDLTGGAKSMTPDTGEIRAEDGSMSKLRRNTETGDLYSPDEPITSPSAPKARASKPKGPNPALQSNIDPESMKRMVTGMGGYRGLDEANRPYKKGGVVKMAKGGLTSSSASRRADGIAQKGKTRGKIC